MMRWADFFCNAAQAAGVDCRVIKRSRGWPETTIVAGRACYTKSMTFQDARNLYFQGVDPKKLNDSGDYALLCGGTNGKLRDIFLIPWMTFFEAIREGEVVNTYKAPKEYLQYKFKVRSVDPCWFLSVQGSEHPRIDVTVWRFSVDEAIQYLKT